MLGRAPVTAACCLALLAFAAPVRAAMSLQLVWTETTGSGTVGRNIIQAAPGDELTADIIATVDAAGVDSYSVSVAFDLDGLDELDLIETIELDHVANVDCDPLIEEQLGPFPACFEQFGNELVNDTVGIESVVESTPGNEGIAGGFEAFANNPEPGFGVVSLSFRVGRVRFLVTDNVADDGADLEASLILDTEKYVDGYIDDSLTLFVLPSDLPTPDFMPGFASVNVPEPSAPVLAIAAAGTLALLRRSRRRRVARARAQ